MPAMFTNFKRIKKWSGQTDGCALTNQNGSVLIVILIILVILSTLAGYLLELTTTSTLAEVSHNQLNRAYFLAEAGGHYSFPLVKDDIESDNTYDDSHGLHNTSFILDEGSNSQDGSFLIQVDDSDPDQTVIHSTGTINQGVYTEVKVTLTFIMAKTAAASKPFGKAAFAGDSIELKKDVTINGDIGTNDSVITKANNVTVTGTEEVNANHTLPQISFSCSTCTTDKELSSNETWSSGTYEYLKVTMKMNVTLTISGDVILYVKEDFVAEQNTIIELLPNSSLTVYVDKKFEIRKDFSVIFNPGPNRPEDFVVYATENADTIKIEKDVNFIGAVYAPDADITIGMNSVIVGAIVGKNMTVNKATTITYDADLLDVPGPGGGGGAVTLGTPVQYFEQ